MKDVLKVICACVASVMLYLILFNFVIKKPWSLGFVVDMYRNKVAYSNSIEGPKVIILAGSNGLYSHRCETIEKEIGVPCVNASSTAGFGIDFHLEKVKEFARPGDVVVMPLEFGAYAADDETISNSAVNPFVIEYDRELLWRFSLKRAVSALFYFDLKFLFSGLSEMVLSKVMSNGSTWNAESLTDQGDVKDHTFGKAQAHRNKITAASQSGPDAAGLKKTSLGKRLLSEFFRWAKRRNITVVGTLPTTFKDVPLQDKALSDIGDLYREAGHLFMVLPNRSQYERDCFYDSLYHLNEPCQIIHSAELARALTNLLPHDMLSAKGARISGQSKDLYLQRDGEKGSPGSEIMRNYGQ